MKGKLTAHFDSVESAERAALRIRNDFPGVSSLRVKPLGKLQENDPGLGFSAIPVAMTMVPYTATDMYPVGGVLYGNLDSGGRNEIQEKTEALLMVTGDQNELSSIHSSLINEGGYDIEQG